MRMRTQMGAVVALALISAPFFACPVGAAEASMPPKPLLVIKVDPRVELLSLIFRMAGNPEYNQGKVASYTADAEKYFGAFRDHAVVKLARELRGRRGVSYDACMSMAVHLDGVPELKLLVPLDPWPEALDPRWTVADANRFLEAARAFVKESAFVEFLDGHKTLYETAQERMGAVMDAHGNLEWFQEFFGERPQGAFAIALGMLNGGSCYGPRCREASGKETLYCVLGVWQTDAAGLPQFSREMLSTVVHEFAHSYANRIVDRHLAKLGPAGDALFKPVASRMRSQAYSGGRTLVCESLVRACEVRYAFRYGGSSAGRRAIEAQKARGFLWMEELSTLFGEYEGQRDQYPTFDAFAPRLVSFFEESAKAFSEKHQVLDARKPKVVSVTPPDGARDVDPNLLTLEVVFDRPMADSSWSLVGGGPNFPETTGNPRYDATGRIWTVPVRLKPGWSYQFMLNSDTYRAFQSKDGVALDPVTVSFKTRKAE